MSSLALSDEPYNSRVQSGFHSTDHAGVVADGAVAYFEDQGMRIRLSAKVAQDTVVELRFLAFACPHLIAATEMFCRQYEGRPVTDLEQFASAPIMQDLAVPVEKTGRILVLEDTVRSLRAAIRDRAATTQD